jgi:hypothetical protein
MKAETARAERVMAAFTESPTGRGSAISRRRTAASATVVIRQPSVGFSERAVCSPDISVIPGAFMVALEQGPAMTDLDRKEALTDRHEDRAWTRLDHETAVRMSGRGYRPGKVHNRPQLSEREAGKLRERGGQK